VSIVSYIVTVRFDRDLHHSVEHREWLLLDDKKPDDELFRSMELTLRWVNGKHGDFRKAA